MPFRRMAFSRQLFIVINSIVLASLFVLGLLPFIHLLSVSLSSNIAALSNQVKLWPVGFTFEAYRFLGQKPEFLDSLVVSLQRVVLGTAINMALVVMAAYPLSKEVERFRLRTLYVWFFAVTMFLGGGLIPTYIVVKETGIMDSIWALILPGALSVWHMVMLLNFFRSVPKDLEEAAIVDGAGQLKILARIYLPISLPAIATILLFTLVGHWNSWFDGILYMNSPSHYPLQSYLYTLVTKINIEAISTEDLGALNRLSEKTLRSAQIFLGALPIMVVYPFLQRYFIKGITVGSVKE
ncbi:ABC transporter permease [Cohnella sp. CIP 111063]|uniref:carbohydrate ABC transporter permease n=1 Tax=unclassified Cohnella TaxID=2636738 RepID=UPI000B9D0D97|nr:MULTISPECIES: carbohydrate ABC transporter permease [unclassified Cohnella]OXS60341.1 ABC transporter permease [Cohnella sp. CIP 111063]PRX73031.1 putative aldouronate transport system permease protein [Cohnella sp. SGD-V74]